MKLTSQKIFQFGFILTSAALVVLLFSNFKNKDEIERLETNNDVIELRENKPPVPIELHSWDIEAMKRKGLKDPLKDIISDLREHRELIPYEGSVGGTMSFYSESKIWILTNKWVLAYFEDGHNGGYLLLEYEVTNDGRIKWKTVASYIA